MFSKTECAWITILILVLFLSMACDPEGPGATGTVSLAEGLLNESGLTLEISTYPDEQEAFSPEAPTSNIYRDSTNMASLSFPHCYYVGAGVGTTMHHQWRVLAWIAESEDNSVPLSGELYGTVTYLIRECGANFGDYCGVTGGVDFSINDIWP